MAASRTKHKWWIQGRADEKALAAGCRFDLAAAERVRKFFSVFLMHSKGQFAGKPFDLLDWQWRRVIAPLFGWKRADGLRRFRRAYIEVPKKNGKSTLCAAIGLYLLVADGEKGAEIYSAAADRDQAAIVHTEASAMVQASSELSRVLEVVRSTKRITMAATNSVYRALSADVPTKEGLNAHGILFDELHAQKSRDLYDTLHYAARARRQPLQIDITTAGYDRHSICWERHEYARRVAAGEIEDLSFLPVIYSADPEDDWTSEAVWAKANPSLGTTISVEVFRQECAEARQVPAKENLFRRYLLNQWTEQAERWLPMERWQACITDQPPVPGAAAVYCGLDLASTTDVAALAMVWQDGPTVNVEMRYWVPEDGIERRSRIDRVPYALWSRQGRIRATPGNVIDYGRIRADLNELREARNIREIGFDRWGAVQLSTDLQSDGFSMVSFGQGFSSMSGPTKELEKLVLGGFLQLGDDPVLRWMAGNVTVETDAAGNYKPSKKKSSEKIDGIVALIMAIGRLQASPADASVYESRGMAVL